MNRAQAVQPPVTPRPADPSTQAVIQTTKYFFGLLESSGKVQRREVVSFTRELTTLLDAGIALVPALQLLEEQRTGKPLGAITRVLLSDLGAGMSFAEALGRHQKVFNDVYVRTIATSDHGAPLVSALTHAAEFLESSESALAQLKKAMIYPSIVLALGLGVSYMMLTVTLPPMIGLFQSLEAGLPLPTRILIFLSQFLQSYKIYLLVTLVTVAFGVHRWSKSRSGKHRIHRTLLKAPVISNIILRSDVARAAGAMSALTSAGLPLADALEVAIDTVSNEVIKDALRHARQRLIGGEGLATPLTETGVFPTTFTQTLRVAEDTGTLDTTLRKIAEFYKRDAGEAVRVFGALLEPLSTVAISLLVGFMALAVIMPMYSVLTALR